MLWVKTSVKESDVHGRGCFVDEAVEKNQLVWSFSPGECLTDIEYDSRDLYRIEFEEPVLYELLKKFGIKHVADSTCVSGLCLDNSMYMNHSDTPSLYSRDGNYLKLYATEFLPKGAELTIDYVKTGRLSGIHLDTYCR